MKRLIPVTLACFLILLFQQTSCADAWKQVKWVVDGDTVILADGQKVRYIGINAPELKSDDHPEEPYAEAAKRFNSLLVKGKKVRLEFDMERFDQYRRLLAYVFLRNGILVNADLLLNGYAYFLWYRPNLKYESILLDSQHAAMSAKKGIWKNWKETQNSVLGNKNSRRFHLLSCPYGKRIKRQNRIVFQKKWDAFWEGYAPGKKCQPVFKIPQH